MHNKSKKLSISLKEGFTLLETLVYLALFSIFIGSGYVAAVNLLASNERMGTALVRQQEGLFLEKKIDWALSGTKIIHSPTANASSTVLSIDRSDTSENPIRIDLDNGCLRISRGTGPPICLNTDRVRIENLEFTHLAHTATTSESVSAHFMIAGEKFGALKTIDH